MTDLAQVALWVGDLPATEWYASPDGRPNAAGTQQSPWDLRTERIVAFIFILCSILGPAVVSAGEVSESDPLAGADARIERHRKADATIEVVDAAGCPVPGAKLSVEQTRHAFLFGCNIFTWDSHPDPHHVQEYRRQYAELLNYATLPFYWAGYEREPGHPLHDRSQRIAEWCKEHGIATKGHPLAWNFADPRWLSDDPQEAYRLQLARIDDCVSRFPGLIDRWDVVNEATHFDRPEFLRRAPKTTGMWKTTGQMEFTRECFLHARQANPNALLLINDYRTDPAYEQVIERLVDERGRRMYDAIGIQSHMHGGSWPAAKIWEVCERFSRFGVPLHFTETTILSNPSKPQQGRWPSTPEGEARQAKEVERFYTLLFSHPAVEAITWWDFSDYRAWQDAPAGLIRADMTPKPAYESLLKLIKGTWWTRASLQADAAGIAHLHGFFGQYRVTAVAQDRRAVVDGLTLGKSAGRWVVKLSE